MEGLCEPGDETPARRTAPAAPDECSARTAPRRALGERERPRTLALARLCAAVADCPCFRVRADLRRQCHAARPQRRGACEQERWPSALSRRGVCMARTSEHELPDEDSASHRMRRGATGPGTEIATLMRSASTTAPCVRKPSIA